MNEKTLYKPILEKLLQEAWESRVPSIFQVIKYHFELRAGDSLSSLILKNPRKAYKHLRDILEVEDMIELLDLILVKYIKRRYRISVSEGLLLKLKDGDNTDLLRVLDKIRERPPTKRPSGEEARIASRGGSLGFNG